MGMFDNVVCQLPLPDGWEGKGLQSKTLGCDMATVTITVDGRLLTDGRVFWRDTPEPRDLEFHGIFNFYGTERRAGGGYVWHEYDAKFTDGQLVAIALVEDDSADPKSIAQ